MSCWRKVFPAYICPRCCTKLETVNDTFALPPRLAILLSVLAWELVGAVITALTSVNNNIAMFLGTTIDDLAAHGTLLVVKCGHFKTVFPSAGTTEGNDSRSGAHQVCSA
jgi:hypothetical protein